MAVVVCGSNLGLVVGGVDFALGCGLQRIDFVCWVVDLSMVSLGGSGCWWF